MYSLVHRLSLVLGDVNGNKGSNSGSVYPGLDRGDGCNFEKIVDGVPTGLGRKPAIPDMLGELEGLKLTGGLTISSFGLMYCLLSWSLVVCLLMPVAFVTAPCAASPSDGPVNRCTTSRKATVSVCTKVVKGLQLPASWIVCFSMNIYFIEIANLPGPDLQNIPGKLPCS
ncbi:Protein SUPPRESSOR OF SILENCING 3 [Tripterygium wilfordii]|uniref:Protein SUPPRESSOR OF SILENCING 3 n=1 Tax=Tripterygium wilfordii TaxID=458696 RepID=A0A7J7DFE5_TRIWF|nr:Protein SUPPRESSOR OF SILENCING 3 [Tripterygium wilfordii]